MCDFWRHFLHSDFLRPYLFLSHHLINKCLSSFAKQQVCFTKNESCFVSCFAKYETSFSGNPRNIRTQKSDDGTMHATLKK
jgi:hypothetical protein